MELYLKQKVFSWGDKFTVYDRSGTDRYFVQGEVFSLGKKLHVYDTTGTEQVLIRQKPFSFLPRYFVSRGGRVQAEIVKQITFFHQEYFVNGPGWTVNGDFWAHEYIINRADGLAIATVSREWMTFGDAYAIRISPDVDELLVLSVVLVIDACIAQASQSAVMAD